MIEKMTLAQRSFTSYFLVVHVVLVSLRTIHGQASVPEDWYTRYPAYPEYCSTQRQMEARAIPPLKEDDTDYGDSELVQVTAVIRHGARTPWTGGMPCWNGYQENKETAEWFCQFTTVSSIEQSHGRLGLEKLYTALHDDFPGTNLTNALPGTCLKGQLIDQGLEQQRMNGEHLRDAYLSDSVRSTSRNMQLWHYSKRPWTNMYFRSDDEERTFTSGQILIEEMFAEELEAYRTAEHSMPVMPLHTADYERDIIYPNELSCPRLAEIRERSMNSAEFRLFNQSQESRTLRHFETNVLGMPNQDSGEIDCLMTTICTDRPLPDAINDFTGDPVEDFVPASDDDHGKNLFVRLYNYYVKQYVVMATHNNAAYSKFAMAPLWAEILSNIVDVTENNGKGGNKLAIFAGHDTTLIPLLASLGPTVYDGSWPPYASMLVIEIHKINKDGRKRKQKYPGNYGFRLIYNGAVLTHLLPECPDDSDMCDATLFIDQLKAMAGGKRDCKRLFAQTTTAADTVAQATQVLSSKTGVAGLLVVVLVSAGMGAVGAIVFLQRNGSPLLLRRKYATTSSTETDGLQLQESYRDDNQEANGHAGFTDHNPDDPGHFSID